MHASAGTAAATLPRESPSARLPWPDERAQGAVKAAAGWFFPFALVLYLALRNGGYDVTVRSEVGIAIWWILLVGGAAGVIMLIRIHTAGWWLIGSLTALALWTGLGIAWSESAERSMIEFARVTTLLGILVLALGLQGREGLRRTIEGVTAAIAVVGALALVSRLEPSWIPAGELQSVPGVGQVTRLNYPLNYWNGLAALMAMGIPLALAVAMRCRSLAGQALAAASIPVMATTAFYTLSRGGAIAIAIAVAVFVLVYPRRLAAVPTLLATGVGSVILVASATQRDALEHGLATHAARTQGDEMLAIAIFVVVAVALLQLAIGHARRSSALRPIEVPAQLTRRLAAGGAVLALVIAVAAGLPDRLDREWQEFKAPGAPAPTLGAARFESSAGSGRYQVWDEVLDGTSSAPLIGIGPGTTEFWWAEHATLPIFLRDAHSLYIETLAELGLIGFSIVLSLIVGVLAIGVSRARRASEEKRALLAGAIGACAALTFAAGVDWAWELTVLPAAFCLLAAAIAGPAVVRYEPEERERRPRPLRLPRRLSSTERRIAIAAGSAAAIIVIAIPYAGASLVERSESEAATDVGGALEDARRAASVEPFAATPTLQEAVLLEQSGHLRAAADAAREATTQEATNWRTWLVLSRIEARLGHAPEAVAAYRRAHELNRRSFLFAR
jgi:hypothetical protein